MKIIIILLFALSGLANAGSFYPYAAIGVGYKFSEPDYVYVTGQKVDMDFGSVDAALIEIGIEYGRSISFGIKHDSQYSTGWPVNTKPEYFKTELFIRYKLGGRP